MFAYLIGLVTAINGLHSCVVAASCEMVPHGQCTVLGMGTIVCYLLSGVISFYRAFCANDEPMKRPLILEGCLVLVATIPWFMAVADVPLFDYTWFVFLTAVAPIVAPPLIYMGCSSCFRQSFQPVRSTLNVQNYVWKGHVRRDCKKLRSCSKFSPTKPPRLLLNSTLPSLPKTY